MYKVKKTQYKLTREYLSTQTPIYTFGESGYI